MNQYKTITEKNVHGTEELHHSFIQDNALQQLSSKCTWFVFDNDK